MLGIDVVKISRIKNVSALAKKILSNDEMKLLKKAPNPQEFMAGRFAAKEAFLKAKHVGLGKIPMEEINVLYGRDGAPIIKYRGKGYDVSISHDGDYAVAVVNV